MTDFTLNPVSAARPRNAFMNAFASLQLALFRRPNVPISGRPRDVIVAILILFAVNLATHPIMSKYHPLDVRHKSTANATTRPWQAVTTAAPIQDGDHITRKARETTARQAEKDAIASVPILAQFWAPARLYAESKGFFAGEKSRNNSALMTTLKVIFAFGMYFALMHLDQAFGINAALSGNAGGMISF